MLKEYLIKINKPVSPRIFVPLLLICLFVLMLGFNIRCQTPVSEPITKKQKSELKDATKNPDKTFSNTVTVMAGTSHNEQLGEIKAGSPTIALEYERTLNSKWGLDITGTYFADRSKQTNRGHTLTVLPFVEYRITDKIFVGAGVQVSKNSTPENRNLISVNPSFEAGIDLQAKRVVFEPYLQASTPDLRLKSKYWQAGGGLNVFIRLQGRWGLRLAGSGFRNYWTNADFSAGRGTSTSLLGGINYTF